MIDWEKEFKEQFANCFLNEKYMDELGLDERVITFIKEILHKKDVAWLKETAKLQDIYSLHLYLGFLVNFGSLIICDR